MASAARLRPPTRTRPSHLPSRRQVAGDHVHRHLRLLHRVHLLGAASQAQGQRLDRHTPPPDTGRPPCSRRARAPARWLRGLSALLLSLERRLSRLEARPSWRPRRGASAFRRLQAPTPSAPRTSRCRGGAATPRATLSLPRHAPLPHRAHPCHPRRQPLLLPPYQVRPRHVQRRLHRLARGHPHRPLLDRRRRRPSPPPLPRPQAPPSSVVVASVTSPPSPAPRRLSSRG